MTGDFCCGRVAACGLQFLCVIAAGSATESCIGIFVVCLVVLGVGTVAPLIAGSLEKFPSLVVWF